MRRRILIIIGHPDPDPRRLCRALADAYAEGAGNAGHAVRRIDVATLDFPLLRTRDAFERGAIPDSLKASVEAVTWAQHIVLVFPLWQGTMPALLKAFLEQIMRPGVAFAYTDKDDGSSKTLLDGRSARIVATMGMPALAYRLWFLSHGIAGMRRNILRFVGIKPVRETLFGLVESGKDARYAKWITKMRGLGVRAI